MPAQPSSGVATSSTSSMSGSFSDGPITFGRALDNDVVIGDSRVSRYHARLEPARHGFVVREAECRLLWESTLAEWEAKAGPRKFDDKRGELEKLKNWWADAVGQPQQRTRIEAAIRRAFNDLQQIAGQIQFARMSLRENAEETYQLLLQTQLDLQAVQKKKKKDKKK